MLSLYVETYFVVCVTDVEQKEYVGNKATGQEATDRSETAVCHPPEGLRDSQPWWRHEEKQQWDVWEGKTNELKPRGRDKRGFAASETQSRMRHKSRSQVQSRWTRGDTERSQPLRNRYRWQADGNSHSKSGGGGPEESKAGGEKSGGEERGQLTRGGGRFHVSEVEEERWQGSGRSSQQRLTGERSCVRKTTHSVLCSKTWRHIGQYCALRFCLLLFPP